MSPGPVPAWWTDADRVELDVLIAALVRGVFDHRESCAACIAGDPPCPMVGEAIDAVLEWRESRHLLSKAEHLRRELDELNILAGANIVKRAA